MTGPDVSPERLRMIELATVSQRMLPQGVNSLGNLNRLPTARLVGLSPGLLEGLPVLLCGAGPSLDKDVPALRKLAKRSVVVAVSTAVPSLVAKGISVDALVCMESMDTSRPVRELEGQYATAWLDVACHPNTWEACKDKPILAYHGPSPEVWLFTWGLQATPIMHGGAVTTAAAASAMLMGCRDLTLVGCDFAFAPDGRVYAQDGAWGDERMELEASQDEEGRQWANYRDRLDWKKQLVLEGSGAELPDRRTVETLPGWDDTPRHATMDYVTQWKWFTELRSLYPHAKLTNCSEGGAKIAGFSHRALSAHLPTTKPAGRLAPGDAYQQRLSMTQPVGERATFARVYAEAAANNARNVGEACMSGRYVGVPWFHDGGPVKAFTAEREIHLMVAQQNGARIPPAHSMAQRRTDAIQARDMVIKGMCPACAGMSWCEVCGVGEKEPSE